MRNKILIATLFLFLFQNVNAQTYLDSLMTKFAHSVADTNKIKLLFKIEKAFINANKPDSAM
jgi:hypothetical protein